MYFPERPFLYLKKIAHGRTRDKMRPAKMNLKMYDLILVSEHKTFYEKALELQWILSWEKSQIEKI